MNISGITIEGRNVVTLTREEVGFAVRYSGRIVEAVKAEPKGPELADVCTRLFYQIEGRGPGKKDGQKILKLYEAIRHFQ